MHRTTLLVSRYVTLVALLTLTVAAPNVQAGQAGAVKDFTLPSATDNSLVRLSDHRSKVVLVNWFRSSCGWSNRETPKLRKFYEKYKDRGLVILGIADDKRDSVKNVPGYLKRHGVTWSVGLNDQAEFQREIRPMGTGETPENYLITRDGTVRYLGRDDTAQSWQKLERAVIAALAKPAPKKSPIAPRALADAPAFALPDLSGKTVRLADFRGKPLLVHMFNHATCDWTGSVVAHLYKEYAPRGLQVVGINLFNKNPAIQACMAKHGARYPVLRGDSKTQMAWIGKTKAWAVFFVSADGKMFKKIINSINNGIEEPVFRKYAEHLLANAQ